MRARSWSALGVAVMCMLGAGVAQADPKPKPVDIKSFRDQLLVLTDADGGTYVVLPGPDSRLWYGGPRSKNLYEQIVTNRFFNRGAGSWDIGVVAPRVPNFQPGSVARTDEGTYRRWCGGDNNTELTPVTGDKAKTILDKSSFLTSAMIRRPYLLARDDSGVYYYVDVIRDMYGGKGHRVFIGKRGAMKQKPLTDIASDSAGDVFATKTGDLRIVRDVEAGNSTIAWVKGEKRVKLTSIDVDASSTVIYRDLGLYTFIGSICEDM